MKKQLLCTSAIALGVAGAPAAAQDWNLDWGGLFMFHAGFAEFSGAAIAPGVSYVGEGLNVLHNGEIIFTPSITLDNGLTFGINVQYETNNSGAAQVDESYMSISGDRFGRLDIGSENSAGSKLMVAAPNVTWMGINSPSSSAFIPFSAAGPTPFRQAYTSSFTEVIGNNDVSRITYYTPDFNGLTIGVSYAPEGTNNATGGVGPLRPKNPTVTDIFDIGVNYSGSFGTTTIDLGARWGTGDAGNLTGLSDPETWGVGFQVGFNNITVGGSYSENDNGAPTTSGDNEGWTFGASYDAAGPWSFSASTHQSEIKTGLTTKNERQAYIIGARRELGPGVNWDLYLLSEDIDNNAGVGLVDGTALGTSIFLSF